MRSRSVLLLALLLAAPAGLAQTDEEQTRAKLNALQGEIKQLDRELSSARSRRDKLLAQLREAETALGRLQQQIAATRADISSTEAELASLSGQQAELEQRRTAQQERLALELETAWKIGRQDQVKVLLNQEAPHTLARAMAYYRYFFDARNEQIEAFRKTLEELAAVQRDIEAQRSELAARQQTLASEQATLEKQKGVRQEAAERLAADINSKGDALAQLKKDQKELEQLLETIQRAVIDMALPDNAQPFTTARGKMPWPVAGKPSNRFGRSRNDGKMTWQGVNIPAAAGQPVRAIHHGRVVYADWFRGSGLLLIIDHGDGYMSLYAHNQSLLREVGEWVQAGAEIGSVGESGGLERPALYFEIRHKGKPVDPAKWCRG
ncbi:peptidoglycan DD-metalloendopeptidase family protein [Parahaliea maris]|uniref:Peptidoglycan DD-metalloendopeptidase family protein n=1 Tax=Parahaliea maris TaxID=2716870 RepID=A0A5C9A1Q8_9GAMM|nr:peptidoglycan DD-metalloendopeptidase family protein [Parahaliea maris]TXS93862.1 peptidoglycan DD-metalloendopeptidase family protein [Parahaliea maris]